MKKSTTPLILALILIFLALPTLSAWGQGSLPGGPNDTPTGPIQQVEDTPTPTQQVVEPTATQTSPPDTATVEPTATATLEPTLAPTTAAPTTPVATTPVPTTPVATTRPAPTETPAGYRPVVVLSSYGTSPDLVTPGKDFTLDIKLVNQGQSAAHNIILTVTAGDFIPRDTGGVQSVGRLSAGDKVRLRQDLAASTTLQGSSVATLEVNISYTDAIGTLYAATFTIALNLSQPVYSGVAFTATPTPTATPAARPQLVISSYNADTDPLQPGSRFNLVMQVSNVGNATARRVTMIAGGAVLNITPDGEGQNNTPGYSAAGGEFTNFSPVGVSNVQSLGELAAGANLSATQPLIVNVSTNPGAYSFKISFVYLDQDGKQQIDDQVISLLVYSMPVVEINFYRDPGPLFSGQPNQLPIQIVNLGRKSFILGNLKVSAPQGEITNNTILVGTLEAGGYFTLDATWFPETPGALELTVSVDYTDDFNQPQTILRTIPVEILEGMPIDPGMDPGMYPGSEGEPGLPVETQPETLWQKFVRFLKGLVGLDSQKPEPAMPPGDMPIEGPIKPGPSVPLPLPGSKGG